MKYTAEDRELLKRARKVVHRWRRRDFSERYAVLRRFSTPAEAVRTALRSMRISLYPLPRWPRW
jgi:acyl-CoA reductase-like NAD-dependent aldehyde dehydrogenase